MKASEKAIIAMYAAGIPVTVAAGLVAEVQAEVLEVTAAALEGIGRGSAVTDTLRMTAVKIRANPGPVL